MPPRPIETLDLPSRQAWRAWLTEHFDRKSEIWLVFHKSRKGMAPISYNDAVEEALCFGWIDSIVRRLDDDRYARKFTPRKASSNWSTINRRRYADLKSRGLLAAPGVKRPPARRSGDAPRPPVAEVPSYIEETLKADLRAWEYFKRLAPSYRRTYIGWIESAKREETRKKRLREALDLLAAGRKLGLK
jgi:uncharacterized protein YdeI (YjbR/CyaY-like superfamily)